MTKAFIGLVVMAIGLWMAFVIHSQIWYSVFLIGGIILFEAVNTPKGFSIFKSKQVLFKVWFLLIGGALAVELIGNMWLNLWDYPGFTSSDFILHALIIGYPLAGFLALELFVFMQSLLWRRTVNFIVLPITAFIFGYINEYPNIFAYEWKYQNWPGGEFLGIPLLVSILWILSLVMLLFKKFFKHNPA